DVQDLRADGRRHVSGDCAGGGPGAAAWRSRARGKRRRDADLGRPRQDVRQATVSKEHVMSQEKSRAVEHDPSAELGLKSPVRDQARIGDTKCSVTPPRTKVRSAEDSETGKVSCYACSAELDPVHSY